MTTPAHPNEPALRRLAAVEARLALTGAPVGASRPEHPAHVRRTGDAGDAGERAAGAAGTTTGAADGSAHLAHDGAGPTTRAGGRAAPGDATPGAPGRTSDPASGSRRGLLRLTAGAAATGVALAATGRAGSVAAADDEPLRIGDDVGNLQGDLRRSSTRLAYVNPLPPQLPGTGGPYAANVFLVDDQRDGGGLPFDAGRSAHPAASAGYGGDSVPNGVYGRASSGGHGVVAHGDGSASTGLLARGAHAALEVLPEGASPLDRAGAHRAGEVVADAGGALWYCVAAGTPGTWRTLASGATAGALHPLTPFRAFDSRLAPGGRLAGGGRATVSVRDAHDPVTYQVVAAGVVPPGATAVAANVTAVRTVGAGFLTVNPGGDATVGASALNWTDGSTIANAGIFRLDGGRRLEVVVGGDTELDLLVDVTGYYR